EGSLKNINSSRLTVDPEGQLYFSNVTEADASLDFYYTCVSFFKPKKEYKLVNRVFLQVVTGAVQNLKHAPVLQFSITRAIKGRLAQLWCIFGGTPMPTISWSRKDGNLPHTRTRTKNFGRTLLIEVVELTDEGIYECHADNGVEARSSHSVKLIVIDLPQVKPQNEMLTAGYGDTVKLNCEATGNPPPEIKWTKNQVPLNQTSLSPGWEIGKNQLRIANVSANDRGSFGCLASNPYGHVYKEFTLNVLYMAAQILQPPGNYVTVEGANSILGCRVYGSPKPSVFWSREGQKLEGSSYYILDNGDLEILSVSKDDSGFYTCKAENKFGSDVSNGSLKVHSRTTINFPPRDYTIQNETTVFFNCTATGDANLNLTVGWLWNNKSIPFHQDKRFTQMVNNSLTINNVSNADLGVYTCVAKTELDEARADANLFRFEIINAPEIINVTHSDWIATLNWNPGVDSWPKISSYVIEIHIGYSPNTWIRRVERAPAIQTSLEVELDPWAIYMFKVFAQSKIGLSQPSVYSKFCCFVSSPARVPYSHPKNVKGHGNHITNLVISWTPVSEKEQNGPNFRYVVQWKPKLKSKELTLQNWNETKIFDWRVGNLTIENQPTFQPYLIRVFSENDLGTAAEEPIPVLGYSGEDEPIEAPKGLSVLDQLDYHSVMVSWKRVSQKNIRGKFKAYKIEKWTQGSSRENILIKNDTNQTTVRNFVPGVKNFLQISVLNTDYAGPRSGVLEIFLSKNVLGPVEYFEAVLLGHNGFYLFWKKPQDPQGRLIGYEIYYEK
ncbi:unnamed protein product, partial [Allacma fusca]